MRYSEETIEEVRARSDIVDVISGYVRLQKKGGSYFGLCPFHGEKTPSFSVNRQKQMYYCFGCHAGGNVFTFIMEQEKYTFVEAVQMLAERAGVELPQEEYGGEYRRQESLRNTLLEINKEAATYYFRQLKSKRGEQAYRYLKNRALSDEMILAFALGYSADSKDDLYRYLQGKGYSAKQIEQAGLIRVDERRGVYDKFWNRVMFPIIDANSRVIGFGGRVMGDGKPKYLNSPETPIFDKSRNLYGLNRARRSRRPFLLLCEGYMDVIALHQAGFDNAVASLGTALTEQHAALIKRYVSEVCLTYDSDNAGVQATLRAIPILKDKGLRVRVVSMEPYKDPDEFMQGLGAKEYEKRIEQAENGFMFTIRMLERQYDLSSPDGKTEFQREICRRLLTFDNELERTNYIETVAKTYRIDPKQLRQMLEQTAISDTGVRTVFRPVRPAPEQKKKREDSFLTSQRILLTWMIDDEQMAARIARYIVPEDFTDELCREIADMVYRQREEGEICPAKILDRFTDEDEHREAAALMHTRLNNLQTEEEELQSLKDAIIRVKENSIAAQSKKSEPGDLAAMQKLVAEQQKLEEIRRTPFTPEAAQG